MQEEDEESEEAEEDEGSSVWNMAQENVPKGDASRRLAVMGCDWDHVAAGDLMVHLAVLVHPLATLASQCMPVKE